MKAKSVLLAGFICFSLTGFSQMGQTSFGVRAGVNFQNLNGKDSEGDKLDNQLKTGFNIGVNAEIPVAEDFYVQPGILLSTKGARNNNVVGNEDMKVKLSYLEIPINFLYKPVLGQGKLLLGFGPYIGFGVGGKSELGNTESDIDWGENFKRFDAGANLLFGYELSNNLSAQLNAQLGLVNINPDIDGSNDKATTKNTGFGISLGYRFL